MGEFGVIDTEMLGITEEDIKEVDASEAEVVSRVLMSRIKDIVAIFRPDGVTFNTTCIRSMIDVSQIQMMIDRDKHLLYVAPAEEYDKDSYRWCNIKEDKRVSRKITGRAFGDRMYRMMGWSKGYTYRVTGYPAKQFGEEGEYLLVFELDEFENRLLTEKGLILAGVDDEDLGEDAAKIHEDIAAEKERKEKAKAEEEASGKKKRDRKKKGYHQEIEDGAFGTVKKDHVDRIEVKTFDQLEFFGQDEQGPISNASGVSYASDQGNPVISVEDGTKQYNPEEIVPQYIRAEFENTMTAD